jgi:hypothetical protein
LEERRFEDIQRTDARRTNDMRAAEELRNRAEEEVRRLLKSRELRLLGTREEEKKEADKGVDRWLLW